MQKERRSNRSSKSSSSASKQMTQDLVKAPRLDDVASGQIGAQWHFNSGEFDASQPAANDRLRGEAPHRKARWQAHGLLAVD